MGEFESAKQSLQKAQELDPSDATNANDAKLLENVTTQERVVVRSVEKPDYETALQYIDQILGECPGSERHALQKLEFLARSAKLQEATTFCNQIAGWNCFKQSGAIQAMSGRITFYNGNEVLAKKKLQAALESDPDNESIKKALRNIKLATELKEKASELFKKNEIQAAIDKFGECLDVDEVNVVYNATIYFNMALGFGKLKKNEEALKCLNKAVQLNPKYAKAFYKRGEINQLLDNHEEALRDFQAASNIDPSKSHK